MIVNWLESLFSYVRKTVKDTKLAKLNPLIDALDALLLSLDHNTKKGPHIRDGMDLKRFMSIVIIALLPCLLFGIYNTGFNSLLSKGEGAPTLLCSFWQGILIVGPLILVSYIVGGFWEVVFASVRKHEINEGFLVSGMLFPLILPPTIPLWQAAVGISFGVVIGKEVFGGVGMNILNPALLARCFLFFTYPGDMSGDSVWTHSWQLFSSNADVISSATPLSLVAASDVGSNIVTALHNAGFSLKTLLMGGYAGSIGETSFLAIMIGAIILLIAKVASYRTMIGVFLGGYLTGLFLNFLAVPAFPTFMYLPAHYHLLVGGFAFGAVFMATDPVTSPSTYTGKWIYGILIGMLAVLIRVFNPAYPEGMMLAILFMNLFAPLFDYYIVKSKKARRLQRAT